MSRLELPLAHRFFWPTGDVLLRANIVLSIKTQQGIWTSVPFIVDPGSEITTMPARDAKRLNLAMPQRASPGAIHQPTGLEIRSGYLRFRVVGMDQSEYVAPCFFLGDPTVPLAPHSPFASVPHNLLGLSGVVDKLRLIFDGDNGPGAAYGHLIVEKR